MLIDWFTVIAQVINFLILVWLLRRFLYKPILTVVNEREKKIADELNDAATREAEAQRQKKDFVQKNNELENQRAALLGKATEEARDEKKRLMDQARDDMKALRLKWQESLKSEQEQLNDEIIQRTQKEVIEVSRKLLSEMADSSLEESIASLFLKKMLSLNNEEKNNLSRALGLSGKIIVQSSYPLPDKIKAEIGGALRNINSSASYVSFETNSKQICGIELIVPGYKLSWTIASYLDLIEKNAALLTKGSIPVKGGQQK